MSLLTYPMPKLCLLKSLPAAHGLSSRIIGGMAGAARDNGSNDLLIRARKNSTERMRATALGSRTCEAHGVAFRIFFQSGSAN